MTTYRGIGRVIRSVGGLFTVLLSAGDAPLDGKAVQARGRGNLRRGGELLVGDLVELSYDETVGADREDGSGIAIERILPRKSALIRPPLSNLDRLFVTVAATRPAPDLFTVDKLIAIIEHHGIAPSLVVTKCDLDPAGAAKLRDVYQKSGFPTYLVGADGEHDLPALYRALTEESDGLISAFSGASGVGKSTLIHRLFPDLHPETGEISRRIARGKNTTRTTELYPIRTKDDVSFLADTPGFTMLDFERFDFFSLDDLPLTFREFQPFFGACRYADCTHVKEEGCAVLAAVRDGKIAPSRHRSYAELYAILKKKPTWGKKD